MFNVCVICKKGKLWGGPFDEDAKLFKETLIKAKYEEFQKGLWYWVTGCKMEAKINIVKAAFIGEAQNAIILF